MVICIADAEGLLLPGILVRNDAAKEKLMEKIGDIGSVL